MARFLRRLLVSSGFKEVSEEYLIHQNLKNNSWNAKTAKKQDKIWKKIIKKSKQRSDLQVLNKSLSFINSKEKSICEIGCGSAYLRDIIFKSGINPKTYIGIDLSIHNLNLSRKSIPLIQANAINLPIKKSSIDIVLDGATLIHIIDWEIALKEYCRISKFYVILHSLSLSDKMQNIFLTKFAYGQKVSEIVFSRQRLLKKCQELNLYLLTSFVGEQYFIPFKEKTNLSSETWILRKND